MSVSTPSTPWRLESGNKFNFEPALKSHHYFFHLLKMLKYPFFLTTFSLGFVALLLITSVGSAPLHHTSHAARSFSGDGTEALLLLTSLPSPPPPMREERDARPTPLSPTSPATLPFMKNPHCSLHKPDRTVSKVCGIRQLDVPVEASGIKSWNPGLCRKFHCKCLATKEVHRMKRTIADNKTTLDTHRYRVFECV